MTAKNVEFDIVVFGASGFTGRLVAEYFVRIAGRPDAPRWAMAGRDLAKLAAVRDAIGAPADTPLLAADSSDPAALEAMARRTRVVLTTVGPYQKYGNELVAACVKTGTDYVDLCGEPAWMRQMIDAHDAAARASGARIVFSCGFDSVPFDLGVYWLQQLMVEKHGQPAPRIKGRVRHMKGTFSGGTAASLQATMAAAKADPTVDALLRNPFSLAPGFAGPKQPSGSKPLEDEALGSWMAPFVMAAINTRNVHRTNALLGHRYGTDFVYDEMVMTGPGEKGRAIAEAIAGDRSMMGDDAPKPGEGPSREEREAGSYDLLFIGERPDGASMTVNVRGDADPGYGSTSKMIAECALCLVHDRPDGPGGVTTPGAALGDALRARLQAHAGLRFAVES